MSVFATADGTVYHATAACAPEGHDRLLAAFAKQAGMDPCGVCQPRDPDLGPATALMDEPVESPQAEIGEPTLEDAIDMADSLTEMAELLTISPTRTLELLGEHGLGDCIVDTEHETAEVGG